MTISDRRLLAELADHLKVIRAWLTLLGVLASTVLLVGLIVGVLWVGDHAGWWQIALR